MVLRWVIRYLANNEQLVNRIADSYPVRRAAQLVVYLFNVGKLAASNTRVADNVNRDTLKSFIARFRAELKDAKEEFKEKAEELKKQNKK